VTRRVRGRLALIALLLAAGCGTPEGPLRTSIRTRVDPARRGLDSWHPMVVRFYRARDWRPAWTTAIGARREAFELEVALDRAEEEDGLHRNRFEVQRTHDLLLELRPNLFGRAPDALRLAELDVLLTRSYLTSAQQLVAGRVKAADLPIDWRTGPRSADVVRLLEAALRGHDVPGALRRLDPPHQGFVALREALQRYRAIDAAGGWRPVGPGARLSLGHFSPRVAALRARLYTEGQDGLGPPPRDSTLFDPHLRDALRHFQRRYGLDTTGAVEARDVIALDVPAGARVQQIELNLERWRWVPDTLGERCILVNIPEYTLRVVEHQRTVSQMRVVVGKPDWPTPVLSAAVRYVVFNPLWNVPATIAVSEVLGEVQKDPEYLVRNNIRVYEGTGPKADEIDPATIHWNELSADNFTYAFRQDPGPANPVGHVKFMCPNPFNVYLHDTPSTQYFRRTQRDLSHGCVRVEQPLGLAQYVLGGGPEWDQKGIAAALDTSRNEAVTVPQPLPVHLLYFTTWVDDQGAVDFRPDLYGIDDLQERARQGQPLPTRDELDAARDERRVRARDQAGDPGRDQIPLVRTTSNPSER